MSARRSARLAWLTGFVSVALGGSVLASAGAPSAALGSATASEPRFSYTAFTPVRWARGIVTADFNGDGHVDVGAYNNMASAVSVLLGAGDGNFGEPVVSRGRLGYGDLLAVKVTDVNGDDRPDVLVL